VPQIFEVTKLAGNQVKTTHYSNSLLRIIVL